MPATCAKKHFSLFVQKLIRKFEPLQIYSFKDLFLPVIDPAPLVNNPWQKQQYFMLMVTEKPGRSEYVVQEFADLHFSQGQVTILTHGKDTVAKSVANNSRFFTTVCRNQNLLYSRDDMHFLQYYVKNNLHDAYLKASMDCHHHTRLATSFLESAHQCLVNQVCHLTAFMLHQAVEQCCIALIYVYLDYRCNIHNLNRQLRLCDSFSTAPSELFLSGGIESQRLFGILGDSYSAARYRNDFTVCRCDAEQLYLRVSAFLQLTHVLSCKKVDVLLEDSKRIIPLGTPPDQSGLLSLV